MTSQSTQHAGTPAKTALVLSGGGNLGSVQVGMLKALWAYGVRPDLIVGTSVGSINGAWLASRGHDANITDLEKLWVGLRRQDIFPVQFGGLKSLLGIGESLVSVNGLRRILSREVPTERIEETVVPLHIIATNLSTGHDVRLSQGNLTDAVCASAAIPGIFPVVTIDGTKLVDGGVVNNCPISHAVALGATKVYVLPCGYACSLVTAPKGALSVALHSISLLIQNRLKLDVAHYEHEVDLQVVPTLCPLNVGPTDFSQSRKIIDEAEALTNSWLADPSVGQRPGLHVHR